MTREDIIRMANEANLPACHLTHPKALERFVKLVEEHERSECLKFCDQVAEYFPSSGFVGSYIGSKIKNRGQA